MEVKIANDLQAEKCDQYVMAHQDGTFFHLSAWSRVVESVFGHQSMACYIEDESGNIKGLLPLVSIRSLLFGKRISSLPFGVYGGVIANDKDTESALIEYAVEYAKTKGISTVEFKHFEKKSNELLLNDQLYFSFRRHLSSDHDENMTAIPRKQRAMVRKGIKAELTYEIDNNADRMYALFAYNMHAHGTPVFSKKLFPELLKAFPENCDILFVQKDGVDVAGVLSFYFKGEVHPFYAGSTDQVRALKANDFMYWALMQHAVDRGCDRFDFGRSKINTGSYSYKKNWGFEPVALCYEYYSKSGEMPGLNAANPKYQLMIDNWKKLPIGLANFIGPFISRNLG